MVETILVSGYLAPRLIEAGRELIIGLDAHGADFEAAFWLMDEENGRWHLMLSSKAVKFSGSMAQYAEVRQVTSALRLEDDFRLGMISIIGDGTPIVKALRKVFGKAPSVDGKRLDNEYIGRESILACVLYRLSRRQKLNPVTPEVRK